MNRKEPSNTRQSSRFSRIHQLTAPKRRLNPILSSSSRRSSMKSQTVTQNIFHRVATSKDSSATDRIQTLMISRGTWASPRVWVLTSWLMKSRAGHSTPSSCPEPENCSQSGATNMGSWALMTCNSTLRRRPCLFKKFSRWISTLSAFPQVGITLLYCATTAVCILGGLTTMGNAVKTWDITKRCSLHSEYFFRRCCLPSLRLNAEITSLATWRRMARYFLLVTILRVNWELHLIFPSKSRPLRLSLMPKFNKLILDTVMLCSWQLTAQSMAAALIRISSLA